MTREKVILLLRGIVNTTSTYTVYLGHRLCSISSIPTEDKVKTRALLSALQPLIQVSDEMKIML